MKRIEFSDKNALKLYNSYIGKVKQTVKILPEEDRNEFLMEINSHIYESMQQSTCNSELDKIIETLEKLGNPEETLSPLVADRKLSQATKTFNPFHVLKALSLNISNGFIYILFSILYLFLFCFVFLVFIKLIYPSNTGLFIGDNGIHFGFIANILDYSQTEVLGNWFIPVMLIIMALTYLVITLLLKLKYKLK